MEYVDLTCMVFLTVSNSVWIGQELASAQGQPLMKMLLRML